jgi:hypothetical protein
MRYIRRRQDSEENAYSAEKKNLKSEAELNELPRTNIGIRVSDELLS